MTIKALDNDKGWMGIIFRKKDDFNYYALDVSKNFLRFRRMMKGE